jgi:hypothetical protein
VYCSAPTGLASSRWRRVSQPPRGRSSRSPTLASTLTGGRVVGADACARLLFDGSDVRIEDETRGDGARIAQAKRVAPAQTILSGMLSDLHATGPETR